MIDLVWRDTVELWQQPEAILLLDQNPLKGLLVLLHLVDGLTQVAALHVLYVGGGAHTGTQRLRSAVRRYLLRTVDENAVQDEVGPEERPLTLDVFKELQLSRLVVQAAGILETRGALAAASSQRYFMLRSHVLQRAREATATPVRLLPL